MTITKDKRWKDQRERWVSQGALFRPELHAVDVLEGDKRAKQFVEAHHYSGSFPASRINVGLFGPHAQLVGVAVFSQPTNNAAVPKYTGVTDGCELGRLILLPEIPFNAESWFVARAFQFVLEEKRLTSVISYADPLERRNEVGEIVKRAHWGTVYQSLGAVFCGRARKRTLLQAPDGTVVNERSLCKLRAEHRGWQYALRQLLQHGAPDRRPHEDLRSYVDRAVETFRRVQHPGNYVYAWGLTRSTRKAVEAHNQPKLAYPKAA